MGSTGRVLPGAAPRLLVPPFPPIPSQMAPGGEGKAVPDGGGCRCSPRYLLVLPRAPRLLLRLHSCVFNRCLKVWWQRKKKHCYN